MLQSEDRFDVQVAVDAAIRNAMRAPDKGERRGAINYNRSRRFVEALAEEFRRVYPPDEQFVVFSGRDPRNRTVFGINEFLYDVTVCACGTVPEGSWGAGLTYMKRAVWQVESEFAKLRRAALADFNKLVVGAAAHKLFIGPQTESEAAFLEPLAPAASHCSGEVWAALVGHPDTWTAAGSVVHLWRWMSSGWTQVPTPSDRAA